MRTLRAVRGKSLVQLLEDGEVVNQVYDYTLHYLIDHGFAVTVERYIQLDTMGDASTVEELGPENRTRSKRLLKPVFSSILKGV